MAMATQKGFITLEQGSLGETTFFKINGKYRAREKGVYASRHKWKYDPGYENRRQIAGYFTNGVKAAKLIRESVNRLIHRKGIDISSRLRKELIKVVYMDHGSGPGNLKVRAENIDHLLGYNFNQVCSLKSVFNTRYSTNADRLAGKLSINIPSFIPSERIKAPKGTTHYKIVSAGFVYDFGNLSYKGERFTTDALAWNDVPTEDLVISMTVPENSTDPLFIYLGLEFIQQVLGKSYPVSVYKQDPLCIVDVFTG